MRSRPTTAKNPAAVALGRKGGLKGAKPRAAKPTSEQRLRLPCRPRGRAGRPRRAIAAG